mgnify:CR=1 FL=1
MEKKMRIWAKIAKGQTEDESEIADSDKSENE